MTRRELVRLALAGGAGFQPAASLPLTYIIDYSGDHLDNPDYIRKVAQAPPDVLHVGHDVLFKAMFGPRRPSEPKQPIAAQRLLDPGGVRALERSIGQFIAVVRKAGVEIVFPYICNQTMAGDAEARLGFWEFYDRWDDYREFGIPPKPPDDPAQWLQRDPDGNIHYKYAKGHEAFTPQFRYAPCPNNPHWSAWLEFVVERIAACGYDGVFVDNNILHCYCRWCQAAFKRFHRGRQLHAAADKTYWAKKQPEFREFLIGRHTLEGLRQRFRGVRDLSSVQEISEIGYGFLHWQAGAFAEARQAQAMGLEKPEQRLGWVETQRFWAWSIAENLLRLQKAGERHKKGFLVVPNWGAMATVHHIEGRRVDAKNLGEWRRGCTWFMFEEDRLPGRMARGIYHDFIPQYKYAFANRTRPVVLPYADQGAPTVELAHAEAAAGGGIFVQGGYAFPAVRRRYREFWRRHPELFTGLDSLAHIGVAFFFNQTHYEGTEHLRHLFHLRKALAHSHLLFDYVREDDVTRQRLARHKVFVLPGVAYIADTAVQALEEWMKAGGVLVVSGDLPRYFENARPRPAPAFSRWVGRRQLHWARDIATLAPLSEPEQRLLDAGGSRWPEAQRALRPAPDPGPRLAAIFSDLAGANLAAIERTDLPGLRVTAWRHDTRVVVHLVNYELTATEAVTPARDVPVSLLLPARFAALRLFTPDRDQPIELRAEIRAGRLRFTVPEVRVYAIAEIREIR